MILTPLPSPLSAAPASGVNDVARVRVAVVIAAWRAAATIGRAIASALAQPETAEVVVVDDASNDDGATIAAARAADDGSGRLQIIALPTNSGPARARNAAIKASRSPWIAVLDSDDFLEPGRFTKLIPFAGQGYDLIADDLLQTPDGQPVSAGRPMWFDADATPVDISFAFFVDATIPRPSRHRRELGFLKPLMRRTFLERHRLAYDETMRLGEDYDLYARALIRGARMKLTPWAGYVSVMRANSLSLKHGRKDLAAFAASDTRLLTQPNLSPEDAKVLREHRFSTNSKIVWIDFMDALKNANIFRAATVMLRDPRQAPYVLNGLWKIFARRITGAKKS